MVNTLYILNTISLRLLAGHSRTCRVILIGNVPGTTGSGHAKHGYDVRGSPILRHSLMTDGI